MAELRQEMEEHLASPGERPFRREEDLRLLIEESMAQLREDCRRNTEEICVLREELEGLEKALGVISGYFAASEEDGEIRDDLGS